jgi:hypothetical protein
MSELARTTATPLLAPGVREIDPGHSRVTGPAQEVV